MANLKPGSRSCRACGGSSRCRAGGRRCGGTARVLDAGFVVGRCSSVHLVLESALDDRGLGATAGGLNPWTASNCKLKESGFILVYTSTITLSCFLLVVEVIKLNIILDLLMTLMRHIATSN